MEVVGAYALAVLEHLDIESRVIGEFGSNDHFVVAFGRDEG
jgi:hypothetical protein